MSYERLLKMKLDMEQKEKIELSKLIEIKRFVLIRQQNLIRKRYKALSFYIIDKVKVGKLSANSEYIRKLEEEIERVRYDVEFAEENVQVKQSQLLNAIIERKKIEVLVEKSRNEEKISCNRDESNAEDEILSSMSTSRYEGIIK